MRFAAMLFRPLRVREHARPARRTQRGSVTPFFAVFLATILMGMLGSIDLLRVHLVQARLQNALDSAALSSGANLINYPTLQGTDLTNWQTDAYNYFLVNFPKNYLSSALIPLSFTTTVAGSLGTGQTITLNVQATVPMLSAGFLPFISDTVSATNEVLRQNMSNLEIVMALDNTGSMGSGAGSKMAGLKAAAGEMVTLMFGSGNTSQTSGNLWVGLVPFASTVNMGGIASVQNWFSPNLKTAWPQFNMAGIDTSSTGWGGCMVEPRAGNVPGGSLDISVGNPASQQFQKYYYNVPPTGLTVYSGCSTSNYPGCYKTSKTNVIINNVPMTLGSGAPNPNGQPNNSFAADAYSGLTEYWAQAASETQILAGTAPKGTSTTTYNQNEGCITHPALFMTSDTNALNTSINNMAAAGSTIIPQGLLWGWRMLSSTWAGPQGWGGATVTGGQYLPLDPTKNAGLQRILIILTDGQNQVSGTDSFINSIYYNGLSGVGDATLPVNSATLVMPNGRIDAAEKHNDSPTDPTVGGAGFTDDLNLYQTALCNAIKADGVTVYAITFGTDASSGAAQASMAACATDSSHYFHAPDNPTLQKIFGQIAGGLSELRLIK
jgi:Flp pilus assembly protein TadG